MTTRKRPSTSGFNSNTDLISEPIVEEQTLEVSVADNIVEPVVEPVAETVIEKVVEKEKTVEKQPVLQTYTKELTPALKTPPAKNHKKHPKYSSFK